MSSAGWRSRSGDGFASLLVSWGGMTLTVLVLIFAPDMAAAAAAQDEAVISGGDTAWVLISTALVLLMTAGLAFFYGGLVRSKNVLNTMMMCFISFGVAGVLWAFLGYSLAFGEGGALVGDLSMAFLRGVGVEPQGSIPAMLFMAFQGTFAIITAALICGAVVGRMRFGAYIAFIAIWGVVVYAPVAHWVWGGGWLAELGALDFAGGAVVHVNAAAAAAAAAMTLGPRSDYGRQAMIPHNVPFVLLGAGLLWFGWMGFNGGSALAANEFAALALVNTLFAPAAAVLAWALLDVLSSKKITAVGLATAIVVGLVAVTPAAGFVAPMWGIAIGAIAAFPSYGLIRWRARTRFDDSLDVFAAHGIGGLSGALLTGVFASAAVNGSTDGLIYGNPAQLGVQAVTVLAVLGYSGSVTFVLLRVIRFFGELRPSVEVERRGIDTLAHGEEGYATGEGTILLLDEEVNGGRAIPPSAANVSPVPARRDSGLAVGQGEASTERLSETTDMYSRTGDRT